MQVCSVRLNTIPCTFSKIWPSTNFNVEADLGLHFRQQSAHAQVWQHICKIQSDQEDHNDPISLTWANRFAYLLLQFHPSSLLQDFCINKFYVQKWHDGPIKWSSNAVYGKQCLIFFFFWQAVPFYLIFICLCWGFTTQSTQWGHVKRGQFT